MRNARERQQRARQCLDGVGIVSVVLVVSGGAVYGVANKVDNTPAKKSTAAQRKKLKSDDDAGDDDTETETIASPAPTMVTRRRAAGATAEKKSPRTKRMM